MLTKRAWDHDKNAASVQKNDKTKNKHKLFYHDLPETNVLKECAALFAFPFLASVSTFRELLYLYLAFLARFCLPCLCLCSLFLYLASVLTNFYLTHVFNPFCMHSFYHMNNIFLHDMCRLINHIFMNELLTFFDD